MCRGAPRDEADLVMSGKVGLSLHTRQRAASRSTMHRPEFGRRSVANCMRRGLDCCRSRGPKARSHTSLGQRPRYRDCVISGGLKARPIGPAWTAPIGLRGLVCSMTWAVGPGWYGARRWRWRREERSVDFPVHVWIRVWWTGMSTLRCPPGRVPRGLAFCGSQAGMGRAVGA